MKDIEKEFEKEAYQEMIDFCLERDELLSAWEADFIASIADRLASGYELTVGQVDSLNDTYNKTKEAAGWQEH